MILDQVTLHNFGVYAGVQRIDLTPPSSDKPIVLFGGLNGAGKTTMMDALQLCIFGPAARCAGRDDNNYKDFLAGKICKHSSSGQASVSVVFRCITDSVEICYNVTRSWQHASNGVREKLKVTRDQHADKSLTENWSQYVNDIMPVNIAHLFFFDGEKIAAYAAPEGVRKLIANGVRGLFGIDLIERLINDLQILERRRQSTTIPLVDKEIIRQKEKELHLLHIEIERRVKERTVLQTHKLDRAQHELACVIEEYRQLGGELRDRREEIQRRVNKAEANLNACSLQMVELAGSELPLILILDLLHDVAARATKEQKILQARATVENLRERDAKMLRFVQNLPDTSSVVKALKDFCRVEIEKQEELAASETLLCISDTDIARLNTFLQSKAPRLKKSVRKALAKMHDSEEEMKAAESEQRGIPPEDSIDEIVKKRDLLTAKISQLENEIAGIDSGLQKLRQKSDCLESEINKLWEKNAESVSSQKDVTRFIRHSQSARQTLTDFSSAVLRRQIGRVEHLALESYQSLLRKDRLISALQINPETFEVLIRDMEQTPIPPEQLSAGERQLLAVALLWGMAKASGKVLPVAIDTPMGRLDSIHRDRLVEQYLPRASHQTLLFTTDEEITGNYLDRLRPWVGKSYHLDYDDTTGATTVSNGFLESL